MTTTPPGPDRSEQLARLQQTAADLVQEVESFAEDSGDQFESLARKARRNRQLIWAVAVSVALDIVLSVVLALVVGGIAGNNHRISVLTGRLDTSQTVTRKNSLCPLYTLLKDSNTPAARAAAPDKAAYDHAVAVIRSGYDALHCADFVTVPPTAGPGQ